MFTTTDLSLLDRMRNGRDQRSWQEFFAAYTPLLMAFARRLGLADADAADAVQETLLAVHAAFQKLDGPFDRSKGRFKAWLRGITQHKVRHVQRRRGRQMELVARKAAEETGAAVSTADADELFELEWQRNLLDRAMKRVAAEVDANVFQAFKLYVIHDKPPAKVAKLLGVSRNAVYISKTRVLGRLRAIVAELTEQEG